MSERILVFIPAYNCEKQIARVFAKIDARVQKYVHEILVVNNRSTDQTVDAAKKAAETIGIPVTILTNTENYNLGGSIKSAFLYAFKHNYEYMITLHGDDQADIRDLLPTFEQKTYLNYDIIIGARFHPKSTLQGYSAVRIAGNQALNVAASIINKRRVYDLIAGLNIFRVSFFASKFFLKFPNNLTFDAHVLLYAFHHSARIQYIPVLWREEDQVSNAKVVQQALTILRLFASYTVKKEAVFEPNKSGRSLDFSYPAEIVFQK